MVVLTLLAVCAILSLLAVRSSYYILKFLAGLSFWGLGVYWIYTPLVAGGSPLNNIMLILVFFVGVAFMFMPFWYVKTENGHEVGRWRLPRVLGGRSEAEEELEAERNARTWRDRREAYRERTTAAMQGRRITRR